MRLLATILQYFIPTATTMSVRYQPYTDLKFTGQLGIAPTILEALQGKNLWVHMYVHISFYHSSLKCQHRRPPRWHFSVSWAQLGRAKVLLFSLSHRRKNYQYPRIHWIASPKRSSVIESRI
ncbi:hypothetical protein BJ165DRAFT_1449025 [Panaeolus papilionaceus]|nr:hypothetical protein BJ165DRAFT_1449025 [Panaeolus papilionaceus]